MSMDERADEIDGSNEAQIRKLAVLSKNHTSRRQLLRQIAGVSLGSAARAMEDRSCIGTGGRATAGWWRT